MAVPPAQRWPLGRAFSGTFRGEARQPSSALPDMLLPEANIKREVWREALAGSFPGTGVQAAPRAWCSVRSPAWFRGSCVTRGVVRVAQGHRVRSGVAGMQTPSADSASWAPLAPSSCPRASGYLVLLSPDNTEWIFVMCVLKNE